MDARGSYDRVAAEYAVRIADELRHKPFDREQLARLAERARVVAAAGGPATVCDMGCGPGQVAAHLHALGVPAVGVDLSPGMIDEARRLHPGLEFRVGDMRALDVPDGAWAGIAAFYSLIHVGRGEPLVAVLRELRRTLTPGGWLLCSFHVGDEVRHMDEWWGEAVNVDFHFFRTADVEAALREAGFAVEESLEREPYPEVEVATRRGYVFARRLG